MNTLVLILTVWSVVLTVVVLTLLRQVTILTTRLGEQVDSAWAPDLALNAPIGDRARAVLGRDSGILVFVSPQCSHCDRLLQEMAEMPRPDLGIVLVDLSDDRRDVAESDWDYVFGSNSEVLGQEFGVGPTPFAVYVEDGRIQGWMVGPTWKSLVEQVEAKPTV